VSSLCSQVRFSTSKLRCKHTSVSELLKSLCNRRTNSFLPGKLSSRHRCFLRGVQIPMLQRVRRNKAGSPRCWLTDCAHILESPFNLGQRLARGPHRHAQLCQVNGEISFRQSANVPRILVLKLALATAMQPQHKGSILDEGSKTLS
jgi:hypothetical protein